MEIAFEKEGFYTLYDIFTLLLSFQGRRLVFVRAKWVFVQFGSQFRFFIKFLKPIGPSHYSSFRSPSTEPTTGYLLEVCEVLINQYRLPFLPKSYLKVTSGYLFTGA